MNEPGKSDKSVVPENSAKVDYWQFYRWYAEQREGRDLAKENGEDSHPPQAEPAKQTDWTQSQVRAAPSGPEGLQQALDRIRQAARQDKELKFTNLWHHVYNVQRLAEAYRAIKHDASAGVDGQTWQAYGQELEANLKNLSDRLAQGTYRAKPVKRVYIPKADGKQRPIGIPVLEDKIVQRATVAVLNAIFETDFLGFSYGFRPGRSCHRALDALAVAIQSRKVSYILDADIRGFFDSLDHEWLIKFLEDRIADRRVIRHIRKWLNAGVLEEGKYIEQEEGVPQGGSISPLLANIYLHYVFDLWAENWRRQQAHGDVVLVRYADDFVVGFQHQSDAQRFLGELRERFRQFNLELHAQKTRVIEFGRFAAENRKRRGQGKPLTFNFLGFTHSCSKTQKGKFIVLRRTIAKRMRAKLREVRQELRRRMHASVKVTGRWLGAVVRGYTRYHAVPRNLQAAHVFRYWVARLWREALRRRSQKGAVRWDRMARLIQRWLPVPHVCHPYPEKRLCVIIQGKSPVR
jgi:group II intron reverse transcriptase/maturase